MPHTKNPVKANLALTGFSMYFKKLYQNLRMEKIYTADLPIFKYILNRHKRPVCQHNHILIFLLHDT